MISNYLWVHKIPHCQITTRGNPLVADQLISIMKNHGSSTASEYKGASLTAPQIYKVITDNLLDGMPCDHANQIVDQSVESLIWKRNLCVHQPYWDDLGANINIYYSLREAWLEGFLMELSYTLNKLDDGVYQINPL